MSLAPQAVGGRAAIGFAIAAVLALPTLVLVFWAGWYLRGFLDALDDTYYGLSFTYEG